MTINVYRFTLRVFENIIARLIVLSQAYNMQLDEYIVKVCANNIIMIIPCHKQHAMS